MERRLWRRDRSVSTGGVEGIARVMGLPVGQHPGWLTGTSFVRFGVGCQKNRTF